MISQRDSKGRFLPGNKARQGKSGKSYAQILREVLDETASRKIIKKAVEQAPERVLGQKAPDKSIPLDKPSG